MACGIEADDQYKAEFQNVNLVAFSCSTSSVHTFSAACHLAGMIALAVQRVRQHSGVILLLCSRILIDSA
ncbi:hypothetical protein BDA96_02G422100 [Sorghum bicolor]|uniref:Uncharacterized protein n=2 Tax=Sorghum bicolor TaxID=4558 RepID=A0A921RUW3_SORBI|nr:hypothetical protein BDA96_02G422100 [Sorghum bicolor]OQU90399.1 hypothetical protein SORBI_3002G401566 [Sorghum bicolor]